MLAGAELLALGDAVADVAGHHFHQIAGEGADDALDVRLLPRGKRGAELVIDGERLTDPFDVVGGVVLAVVGLEDFADPPGEQGAAQQGGNGGGLAGLANLDHDPARVHINEEKQAVALTRV